MAVTLQDFVWRVILNRQIEIMYIDPFERDYDTLAISLINICSPNLKIVFKVKEIAFLGHARDIEEITSDFGA